MPPSTHAADAGHAAQRPPPVQQEEPAGQVFRVGAAVSDKAIHPQVLHEDAEVKLAVVTIKPGATMAGHAVAVPVTVLTISGKGSMTIAGVANVLEPGKIYLLDAGAFHALWAEGDVPLVVLVHYLKGGAQLDRGDDHGH